jgi:uncharacterized protein
VKLLFATDLHGSTLVLKKAILVANEFDVDLVVLGGDFSGKRLVPILSHGSESFVVYEPFVMSGEAGGAVEIALPGPTLSKTQIAATLDRLEGKGHYWHFLTPDEFDSISSDRDYLTNLFEDRISERILTWARIVTEELDDGRRCIWMGGNDDDERVISRVTTKDLARFEYSENIVVEVEGFQILSYGKTNLTGFDTPRELSDNGQILRDLENIGQSVLSWSKCICNIHSPPQKCGKLDSVSAPNGLGFLSVGSTDVRKFIERYQPIVQLAGHIHEGRGISKIGMTSLFNPGSEYHIGKLNAFVLDIQGSEVKESLLVER